MIRFLVDEDFNNDILRGLRRRMPDVDAPRIQALGLAGVSDETVLALAASENRVVLTHDVSTLVASAYRRVEAAEPMPGVIAVAQSTLAGVVSEDLVVIVECSKRKTGAIRFTTCRSGRIAARSPYGSWLRREVRCIPRNTAQKRTVYRGIIGV